MRDAREWVREFWTDQDGDPWPTFVALVRRVQSDAARSERERCAEVCESIGGDGMCGADAAARKIRSLPDALGAAGAEEGEAT